MPNALCNAVLNVISINIVLQEIDLAKFMSWDMGDKWYHRGFIPPEITAGRFREEMILLF